MITVSQITILYLKYCIFSIYLPKIVLMAVKCMQKSIKYAIFVP